MLPTTGGESPDLGLVGYLAEQLPVAVLMLLGGYYVARYAAGVMDKLLSQQAEANSRLAAIIERNTSAWGDTTVALARLTEGVTHVMSLESAQAEELQGVRREISDVRTLLATRPCVGEAALRKGEGRDPHR